MPRAAVDGNHVLYHFLQKELQQSDYWLFQMMVARLVASLAIWYSPDTYRAMPILVPFAVRDPRARGNKPRGEPDQWGSPNAEGYFRDDNSLIKGLPKRLKIDSPTPLYDGRSIGNGFVASHVWREVSPNSEDAALASRHPFTYSFVPNLVWLPTQVSKLTDREGSFAQQYLQGISLALYRNVQVDGPLGRYVDKAWALLPEPVIPQLGVPPIETLSIFQHEEGFVARRRRTVNSVMTAFSEVIQGQKPQRKVVSSRYGDGLNSLSTESASHMVDFLEGYSTALDSDRRLDPDGREFKR